MRGNGALVVCLLLALWAPSALPAPDEQPAPRWPWKRSEYATLLERKLCLKAEAIGEELVRVCDPDALLATADALLLNRLLLSEETAEEVFDGEDDCLRRSLRIGVAFAFETLREIGFEMNFMFICRQKCLKFGVIFSEEDFFAEELLTRWRLASQDCRTDLVLFVDSRRPQVCLLFFWNCFLLTLSSVVNSGGKSDARRLFGRFSRDLRRIDERVRELFAGRQLFRGLSQLLDTSLTPFAFSSFVTLPSVCTGSSESAVRNAFRRSAGAANRSTRCSQLSFTACLWPQSL
jgi:hypothetical protein